MHRRTNHHGPTFLHAAVSRELTTGLCASPSAATLAQLSTIDCLACTLGKSKYADHVSVNPVLRQQGIERQRIPGHITTRGHHGGLAPYELLAIDLKTDLPKTRQGCTICMIVVCLFSMRRHTVALKKKHEEYDAFRNFISQVVEGQGFKTRRLRKDISGEQTSHKMIEFCISKGIRRELVPHAN